MQQVNLSSLSPTELTTYAENLIKEGESDITHSRWCLSIESTGYFNIGLEKIQKGQELLRKTNQIVTFSWTNGTYCTIFTNGYGINNLVQLVKQYGPWNLLPIWYNYNPKREF